jgi:uncharacterized protein YndB with AHSA1/START domain
MSDPNSTPATVHRDFPFPAETVYDAWLTPDIARQFLFATPDGEIVRAEIDPQVGGRFVMTDRRRAGDVEHVGTFVSLDRPRRIAFDFGIPADSEERARVFVEFDPNHAGCRVTVTHFLTGDWADFVEQAREAWAMMLRRLENALE